MAMHVVELLGAYALDALDEPVAGQVRAHLAECSICRMEFARFTEVSGRLAGLSPARAPALDLRGRVIAVAEHAARARVARPIQRPRMQWAWAAIAVVVVLSQAWLVGSLLSVRARLDQQAEVQTILLSSDSAPVKLEPPDPAARARGVFRFDQDLERGLLNYYHLAPPGRGEAYQCWFEFATGPAEACGRLTLDQDGSGLLLLKLPAAPPVRLRVTLERAGAATPSGATVLSADLFSEAH